MLREPMADDESEVDGKSEGPVVVATFRDSMPANLCRMALGDAGIQAWLSTENLAGVAPHLGIALGIDVLVRGSDVSDAREVLADVDSGSVALPDEADPCPQCRAFDADHVRSADRAGALLGQLFVGVPRPSVVLTWKCRGCGHEWR
jgi:hypothetical protein